MGGLLWPVWSVCETTHFSFDHSSVVFPLFPLSAAAFKVTIFQKCGGILVKYFGSFWSKKNTHKFSTAGLFNEQRESDLTICIQIGPSFLQYHLLKTHFCLAVGFSEGVKNPVIYIIDGDISIQPRRAQEFYCDTIHKGGFGFLGFFELYFWFLFLSESISSTISVCWLSLYLQVSGHVSLFTCRKTHSILIPWLQNKLKYVKPLHPQRKTSLWSNAALF